MSTALVRQYLHMILILVCMSSALAATTVDELIESYDYDFNSGVINVTIFNDTMLDKNGNGVNDTLVLNLTTNAVNSSTYLFIVSLFEKTGVLRNYTNKTVNSSSPGAQVSFSTRQLSLSRYNYSVEIRRQDFGLVFMKYKTQTRNYSNYEKGVEVTGISDQSVNNNFIRIALSLNITENKTESIAIHLRYANKSISATKEEALIISNLTLNVDFDNETIKSTHYNGNYSIESITIGNKLISMSHNTSSYNYMDFAKTSYIRNISSGTFDNDSNGLFDALQFNFTLNITRADNYTIEAAVYTSEDDYVITLAKNITLIPGINTTSIEIAGGNVYSTYYNGFLKLSFVKLSAGNNSNITKDIIYEGHTTNLTSYGDFERPPLPDLMATITTNFSASTNVTNVTINVTNIGDTAAFNIIVNLFDNATYDNETSFSYLNLSESRAFHFLAANTSNQSLFVAIVDFDNLVDESDESNNVAVEEVSLSLNVSNLSQIHSEGAAKVFEFMIRNDGESNVNNVTWRLDTGDGTVISSVSNSSLTVGETLLTFVHYTYPVEGNYVVTANATAISEGISTIQTIQITAGALSVSNFSIINSSGTLRTFEAYVKNYLSVNLTNISWSLNTGNGIVASTSPITLQPQETGFVFVQYNYTATGTFAANFTAVNGSWSDLEALNVTVT